MHQSRHALYEELNKDKDPRKFKEQRIYILLLFYETRFVQQDAAALMVVYNAAVAAAATVVVAVAVVVFCQLASAQTTFYCPDQWPSYQGHCYRFEGDSLLTYDDAKGACGLHGAGVLSVETAAEHSFIVRWLEQHDLFQRVWYTSGVRADNPGPVETKYKWESTGEDVTLLVTSLWLQTPDEKVLNGVIAYGYGHSGFGLKWVDRSETRPYICKIPEREAYRIRVNTRGFDYGLPSGSPLALERGPHFLVEPRSVVVVSQGDSSSAPPVVLDCVVAAVPQATYHWFKGQTLDVELTMLTDDRITITNGRLTIQHPNKHLDWDVYRCVASNEYGTVISSSVEITFGDLGEFNNVKDAGTRAKAFDGAILECSPITYKPAISYQWLKGDSLQFVRPEFQDYIFISKNGKLYFSEVTRADESTYKCIAVLIGVNRYTLGTGHAPTRTSLPIPLIVDDQAPKSDWGPEIQNDFPAVFPSPPLRGQDVRLECFAYGSSTTPFRYSWSRDDKPLPAASETFDHDRVLVLHNAQLEDSGVYRCTVSRGHATSDTKTVTLNLGAKPYFVSPLRDQHADIDSQLTWICHARGNPEPVYSWYRNGQLLTSDPRSRLTVKRNVLSISLLDPDLHNGMYQCGAANTHGESMSNAQLRVLALPPSLERYPPPSSVMAARGGNLTLRCHPEGAPYPTIEWSKGGSIIANGGDKYTVLSNGNLHVARLASNDRGVYTCTATNHFGSTQASSSVIITEGVAIMSTPSDDTVVVNQTTFLPCQASHPEKLDMVYEWTFNDFRLDFRTGHYQLTHQTQATLQGLHGLYLISTQFQHQGLYTCIVRSPFVATSHSAYVTVKGPPRRPGGVVALTGATTTNSTVVEWVQGSSSGGSIGAHVIQIAHQLFPHAWQDYATVRPSDSVVQNGKTQGWHSFRVAGLNPGTDYRFRVLAVNEYGRGLESSASAYVRTFSAPPAVAPRNLRGGGGSIGTLTIRWNALDKSEYGTSNVNSVGYRVFWRLKHNTSTDSQWSLRDIAGATVEHMSVFVGEAMFFTLYETKLQAVNDMGFGPNSSIAEVYSAETLPTAVPQNVNTNTFNSTAIEVFWVPVPQVREFAGGTILGYQINYWNQEDPASTASFIKYYGQLDYGLVIGLDVDVNMVIDVQVFNSAGLGARSNRYIMETSGFAPLTYPQEVHIWSAGEGRAHLWWRGITITTEEEGLTGYAIWLWSANESPGSAELIELDGMAFHYTLRNLDRNTLYALRLAAVGGGGYGKKTPTIYFTVEGQIEVHSHLAETIDILSGARSHYVISSVLVAFCVALATKVTWNL
ncbi:hypothetical protein RRG08_021855 [Elysia crispata]|uniref:Contactin n=1 Tax=Elysia crispata TaxID=231223 RepID=A0AAE0YGM2_9GAST|nr:hypothetical protein RRG08_021855 [Elysia crispata]